MNVFSEIPERLPAELVPAQLSIEATLQAQQLWTGEPQRDNHIRSAEILPPIPTTRPPAAR
jgi:hypothetical protein